MRPERLEVRGFTAFRDTTVVDFSDVEVFAFTGPTGAGKSSLIDAIVFALYGSVPRYGDNRVVAPLITLGKLEARVRFDFSFEGRNWTAVRVVRRNSAGGASTDEARLECEGEVVAAGADEVSEAVEALLGLGYEHFTKSVVLPQGEFARFLHDRPAQRQALLRSLLDVGVYANVREMAAERAATLAERCRGLEARLSELNYATADSQTETALRLEVLTAIYERVAAEESEVERKLEASAAASAASVSLASDLGAVEGLARPERVAELANLHREALASLDARELAARHTGDMLARAELRLQAAADRAELLELKRAWQQLAEARSRHDELTAELALASEDAGPVEAAAQETSRAAELARSRLEEVRSAHAAHLLAADLKVGEACPVCTQTVVELPDAPLPVDLETAEQHLRRMESGLRVVQAQLTDLVDRRARIEARLQDVGAEIASLEERLEGAPTPELIGADLAETEAAAHAVAAARADDLAQRRELTTQQEATTQLRGEIDEARRHFEETRDRLGALGPPGPARLDLSDDWDQLVKWALQRRKALESEAREKEELAARHRATAEALAAELDDLLRSVGLEPAEGTSREKTAFEAVTQARHQLDGLSEALLEAGRINEALTATSDARKVAETLALHLRADRFEAWLLDEALRVLTEGANALLSELSSGAYSLRLTGRKFEIVDHRNADESRSVRTLSGGETFLVSLALALSLAEQLGSISGRARSTEAIFLDEGFGSLDRETLEVVGSVIHELGATGRIVGIVTHVTELADQAPVRFEVTKGPDTAHVVRVDG